MEISKSAFRILTVLWDNGSISAKEIVQILKTKYGWNKNTTYTVLNRCIKDGYIERIEPDFICKALVTKEQVQVDKLKNLIDSVFEASPKLMVSTLIESNVLSQKEVQELRDLIDEMR